MNYRNGNWAIAIQFSENPELLYDPGTGVAPWVFIELPQECQPLDIMDSRGTHRITNALDSRMKALGIDTTECTVPGQKRDTERWYVRGELGAFVPRPDATFHASEYATAHDVLTTPMPEVPYAFPGSDIDAEHGGPSFNLTRHLDQQRPLCFVHPLNQPFYSAYLEITRMPWEPTGWSVYLRDSAYDDAEAPTVVIEQCNADGRHKNFVLGNDWNHAAPLAKNSKDIASPTAHHIAEVGSFYLRSGALNFVTEDYECALACETAFRSVRSTAVNPMDPEFVDQIKKKLFMTLLQGPEKDRP